MAQLDRPLPHHLHAPPLCVLSTAKAGEITVIMITVPKSSFFMTLSLGPRPSLSELSID